MPAGTIFQLTTPMQAGICTIRLETNQQFLNDPPACLKGFGRHELYGQHVRERIARDRKNWHDPVERGCHARPPAMFREKCQGVFSRDHWP